MIRFSFRTLAAVASLCLVAQTASSAITYSIDDGTAETAVGLSNTGDFIALNSFTVSGGNNIISSISIAFSAPNLPGNAALNGLPFLAVLWGDPSDDGIPNDAMVLATAPGLISNVGTNTFITTSIVPTLITTTNFFVGFELPNQPGGSFPGALDRTAPTFANRSFVAGSNPGMGNIFNLSANGIPVAPIENFITPGNWLIRADAVTAGESVPDASSTFALSFLALVGLSAFALGSRARASCTATA
jgi:hypothetical protein